MRAALNMQCPHIYNQGSFLPSRHTISKWRRINVDATLIRRHFTVVCPQGYIVAQNIQGLLGITVNSAVITGVLLLCRPTDHLRLWMGLTFTTLSANSADDKLMIFYFSIFFRENRIWNFKHLSLNLVFWETKKKVFQNVVCWKFYPEC